MRRNVSAGFLIKYMAQSALSAGTWDHPPDGKDLACFAPFVYTHTNILVPRTTQWPTFHRHLHMGRKRFSMQIGVCLHCVWCMLACTFIQPHFQWGIETVYCDPDQNPMQTRLEVLRCARQYTPSRTNISRPAETDFLGPFICQARKQTV